MTSSTRPVDSEERFRFDAETGYNSHGVTSSFGPVDKVWRVVVGRTGYNSQGVTSSTGPVPTKEERERERVDTDGLMALGLGMLDVLSFGEEASHGATCSGAPVAVDGRFLVLGLVGVSGTLLSPRAGLRRGL